MDYFRHVSGQPLRDPYELSHTPRASVPYEPRSCDLVEFEADERVQHVVLASPSVGTQTPIDRDRLTDRNASSVGQRRIGG